MSSLDSFADSNKAYKDLAAGAMARVRTRLMGYEDGGGAAVSAYKLLSFVLLAVMADYRSLCSLELRRCAACCGIPVRMHLMACRDGRSHSRGKQCPP